MVRYYDMIAGELLGDERHDAPAEPATPTGTSAPRLMSVQEAVVLEQRGHRAASFLVCLAPPDGPTEA